MDIEQIKEIKEVMEKIKETAKSVENGALVEQVEQLENELKKLGEKLDEEVDLWEREREDVYEGKGEKNKEFRKIAEELKN